MSNLARSCLRMLAVYALAGVAVGVVVYHRFPQMPAAIWSGVIAGFFIWLTFAYLWAIPTNLRDWWRMRSGAPPRNGKRVAIIGPIHNIGGSLHAPFSKTPCVAYHYKITALTGENPNTDYEGFAMVPSYVNTEAGQVKLLAYPDLEIKEEPVRGPEAKEAAREYLQATQFLAVRQEGIKSAMAELKQLMADDDGAMRYDHRLDPVAASLDECRLTEKLIRTGDTVCVLGLYSEERRAIVPDPSGLVSAATIKKGEPASLRRGALRKAFGSVIGVAICGGLVTAAALIFFVNVPMDASEQMNPQRRFLWEEVKLERWLDRKVRTPLVKAGTLSTPGMHMLELCEGCATGRLEANGRVIELKHASGWQDKTTRVIHLAAAAGEKDGVTITFDRTKPVNEVRELPSTITITITVNGRDWVVPEDWKMPADVQTAFGQAEVADGRVTVVGPDDNVRVRAAFRVLVEDRQSSPET